MVKSRAYQMKPDAAGHVISEANGRRSREQIVLAADPEVKPAGLVLGKVNGSSVYKRLAPAAADGTEFASAVLFERREESPDDDQRAVGHVRECELADRDLVWPEGMSPEDKATAMAQLNANQVLVRF